MTWTQSHCEVMILPRKLIKNIKLYATISNHLSDFSFNLGGHTVRLQLKENQQKKLDEKSNYVTAPLVI